MIERLNNLNAFHILNNDIVYMIVCLHISCVLAVIVPHEKEHGDHRQNRGNQNCKAQTPVNRQQPDKNSNRKEQVRCQLRDHVGQRRLQILHLVHDNILQVTDPSSHYFAKGRSHQSVCDFQADTFQYRVSGDMCQNCGNAKADDADQVSAHSHQTPEHDVVQSGGPVNEQEQDFIHRPKRNKASGNT